MIGFEQQSIPGHVAEFKDQNLRLKTDTTPPTSEAILFLGTATDGPLMQPVRVTPDNAELVFGKTQHRNGIPNGATLLPKFEEAWAAGCRDIRLMRVTGQNAVSSLAGQSYSETVQEVMEDDLSSLTARGNVASMFNLEHGGVKPATFKVRANGVLLPPSAYTLTAGTAGNAAASPAVAEVKGKVALNQNVTDMEAEITVTYDYEFTQADGTLVTTNVYESNVDAAGVTMIAHGADVVVTLQKVPVGAFKLYVNDAEFLDETVYTVSGDQLTIHSTGSLFLGDTIAASYGYNQVTVVNPTIHLVSVYAGDVYNDVKVKVEVVGGVSIVTITKPDSKKAIMSEQPMVFKSSDYGTFAQMVNGINEHPLNNVVRAATSYEHLYSSTLQVKPEGFMTGGRDGLDLSKEEMYKALGGEKDVNGYTVKQGAYQLLENYKTDYVIPLGVYADDKLIGRYDNFAYQLALACAVMSHFNNVTIGLISTSTPRDTNLAAVEAHVKKLEKFSNEYYMRDRFGAEIKNGNGDKIDIGQFIEVHAGPDVLVRNTRLGLVASTSPATFAGMISNLPVNSAPTNKAMKTAQGLRFEYSTSQLNRLTRKRYTTLRYKPNGSVGIVDAMTSAHVGSDYTRLSTARIVKAVVNTVREIADPFIGETNDVANRNALTSAIEKRLSKMVDAKALLGFEVVIVATPQMELIGEASIELRLDAPNELRSLTSIVSLSA